MGKVIGNIVGVPNPKTDWNQNDESKADCLKNKPTKVSQFENDAGYLTEHQDISHKADKTVTDRQGRMLELLQDDVMSLLIDHSSAGGTSYNFDFTNLRNTDVRMINEAVSISFTFGKAEYSQGYMSGLSFDSGATPTQISYTNSGILNWVGTDCTNDNGYSIFQPSANTHYDIVFYFNGTQFIGLVNGYVPAIGNVVSE